MFFYFMYLYVCVYIYISYSGNIYSIKNCLDRAPDSEEHATFDLRGQEFEHHIVGRDYLNKC